MSSAEARVAVLEARIGRPMETLRTEQGRQVRVPGDVLLDAWLHAVAPLEGELLPVEVAVRDALAVARIPTGDWQLAQIKRAARRELGLAEVTQ